MDPRGRHRQHHPEHCRQCRRGNEVIGPQQQPAAGPRATFGLILVVIWALATIVPSLALTVRRLHDSNKSGWMILLGLIPFAGPIIVVVFTLLGPDPARFDQPAGY
jgi:uncharacterized membrane protein YhaH (DUF805 family)